MAEVTVCLEFRSGKGYCYITVIPTDYEIYRMDNSECVAYTLKPGSYEIMLEGISPAGGTKAELFIEDVLSGTKNMKEGPFSRYFNVSI